ncbi:unnamed protein product [Diplocarpon coronariae]
MKLLLLVVLAQALATHAQYRPDTWYCDHGDAFKNGESCSDKTQHTYCCVIKDRGTSNTYPVGRTCVPGKAKDTGKEVFPICNEGDAVSLLFKAITWDINIDSSFYRMSCVAEHTHHVSVRGVVGGGVHLAWS